jgi:hypothetical protein
MDYLSAIEDHYQDRGIMNLDILVQATVKTLVGIAAFGGVTLSVVFIGLQIYKSGKIQK